MAASEAAGADFATEIRRWMEAYDRALVAKDLERLAAFYHPHVTIFEGGGVNQGWADYRDDHLGPELAELEGLEFAHQNVMPRLLGSDGRTAYVTAEYRLRGRLKDREIDSGGLVTLILGRGEDGAWKIWHAHMSSRRRPAGPPPPQK